MISRFLRPGPRRVSSSSSRTSTRLTSVHLLPEPGCTSLPSSNMQTLQRAPAVRASKAAVARPNKVHIHGFPSSYHASMPVADPGSLLGVGGRCVP
jgi:hypothetical protein